MPRPGRYPPGFLQQLVELVRAGRSPESLARNSEPSDQKIRNWVILVKGDEGVRRDGPQSLRAGANQVVAFSRIIRSVRSSSGEANSSDPALSRDTEIRAVRGHVDSRTPDARGWWKLDRFSPLLRRGVARGAGSAADPGAEPPLPRRDPRRIRVIGLGPAAVPCPGGGSCGRRSAGHGSSAAGDRGWPWPGPRRRPASPAIRGCSCWR